MLFKAILQKPIKFMNSNITRTQDEWLTLPIIDHEYGHRIEKSHMKGEEVAVQRIESTTVKEWTYHEAWLVFLSRGNVVMMNTVAAKEYLQAVRVNNRLVDAGEEGYSRQQRYNWNISR